MLSYRKSARFHAGFRDVFGKYGPGGSYDLGVFELEAWVCELSVWQNAGQYQPMYANQCMLEKAGRWIHIPYLLISIAALATAYWTMRVREYQRYSEDSTRHWPKQNVRESDGNFRMSLYG